MHESRQVNVVCLKWGTKYGPEYVNRLSRAVRRHVRNRLDHSYQFWCFTDDARGIDADVRIHDLPYRDRLEIWWNKLWLFSNELPWVQGQPVFYIDLDTLITGDLTDMLYHDYSRITVLRDFYQGLARTAGVMGSGLMAWRHGDYVDLWEKFWADPQGNIQRIHPLGDQKWIELETPDARDYWQDIWPNRVVSFKVHCRWGLPDQARIVCYHGVPSIPDSAVQHTRDWKWRLTPQPWVLEHWRD